MVALLSLWNHKPRNKRRTHLLFAAILLIIGGAAAYIGPPPSLENASDFPQFFDGGWRIMNGQRPHIDFYSSYGVLVYAPAVIGLLFSHTAWRLGYANSFVGLLIGLWAYRIASRRMNVSGAALASLSLTLLAIAPYSLGEPPWILSYAMIYNRQSYALLGILLIEAYSTTGELAERARDERIGGISSGAIAAILLFMKPSYFFMALLFLALSLTFSRSRLLRCLRLVAAFSGVALGVLCYLRFDTGAWIRDLRMVAGARETGLALGTSAAGLPRSLETHPTSNELALADSLFPFAGLAVCAVIAPLAFGPEILRKHQARGRRQLVFAVTVSLAGFMLLLTNWQRSGLPLNALFAMILAAEIPFEELSSGVSWRRFFSGAFLVLTLMVALPPLCSDALGLSFAIRKRFQSPKTGQFHAQTLAGLTTGELGFVAYVNDGLDLLRQASTPRETVTTFDFSEPFSYALERPPFGVVPSRCSITSPSAIDPGHLPTGYWAARILSWFLNIR
jgi:hypothetical protein